MYNANINNKKIVLKFIIDKKIYKLIDKSSAIRIIAINKYIKLLKFIN